MIEWWSIDLIYREIERGKNNKNIKLKMRVYSLPRSLLVAAWSWSISWRLNSFRTSWTAASSLRPKFWSLKNKSCSISEGFSILCNDNYNYKIHVKRFPNRLKKWGISISHVFGMNMWLIVSKFGWQTELLRKILSNF